MLTILKPQQKTPIRGILFDMDGVVIDSERLFTRFWMEAAADLGFPMTREQALQLRSLRREEGWQKMNAFFGPTANFDEIRARRIELMEAHIALYGVDEKPGIRELLAFLKERNIPCVWLSEETERTGFRITPDITVRAFQTRHLDKQFEKVRHFCYLITFGDKNVLFTGDVDYVNEDLSRLKNVRLDAAFINPLFFSVLCHGKFFRGRLEAQHILVYHVPFLQDDTMGMLTGLERNLARWPEERGKVTALGEPFQQVFL